MKNKSFPEKKVYAVTGASGNVGSVVARQLRALGHEVRPVSRQAGVPFEDDRALARAFAGADGIFLMLPPDTQADDLRRRQNELGEMAVRALGGSSARRLVFLSSFNAEHASGTGPILGLHDLEHRLEATDIPELVYLRPAFFMENHLRSLPVIRQAGVLGSAFAADEPLPMIATRDIGLAAAAALTEPPMAGRRVTRDLLGPRDYTLAQAAAILGAAIGRPGLPYVQFTYEQARDGMVRAGLSPSYAEALLELTRSFNERRILGRAARTPRNTTPTTLEVFSREVFQPAFAAAQAA